MALHPISINASTLTEQGEAHVVLVQITAPNKPVMLGDGSRTSVIETLRELLGPKQLLSQIVTGSKPAIVVLPELALGFDDWTEVDVLVRAWKKPLVLLAGFGFTQGQKLIDWLSHPTLTKRIAGWPDGSGPASERKYNCGYAWIKTADGASCVLFLKSTAEQVVEIQVPDLDQGSSVVVSLEFNDLILIPIICSDFLSVVDGARVVERKIARYLDDDAPQGRKVLIAGLLLQPFGSEKWRVAVSDMTRINGERINLCLVNTSCDFVAVNEEFDRWRAYSGIYVSRHRKPFLEHFPAVRRFSTDHIEAGVVRGTLPLVVGGAVRWSFDGATGRHLWEAHKDYAITPSGELGSAICPDRFQFELIRILCRLTQAHDAPPECTGQFAKTSYQAVRERISAQVDRAESISRKLLHGGKNDPDLTAETLSNHMVQNAAGLRVLGALKSQPDLSWQDDASQPGQLWHGAREVAVLVWYSPESPISMRQTISTWASDAMPRPPIILYCKATGPTYAQPADVSRRRRDISQPPGPERRSAAEPAIRQVVIEQNLDEIEYCFIQNSDAAFAQAVKDRLAVALAAIG